MKTIFVSSTFKDMQYERDAIRDKVAPKLNEEAREHGDELDFCDLRWGINTGDLDTEEGSKKVLDVCLDEIDRSEPPMVVLLGYRYGWIPDGNLIKTAAERKHLELEDLERSVTALEIEYGALCDEKKFRNTLFYFREIKGDAPSDYLAEDKDHAEKISALKNRIKSITGGKVKKYTLTWNGISFDGIDIFIRMLTEDIKKRLMPEWKRMDKLTPFQHERRTHAAFISEKNAMFRARRAEAEELIKDSLSQPFDITSDPSVIITGEAGSGKSTLFSYMATEFEKSEWTVLPFISGLTPESNSVMDIIKNTAYFMEEELHIDHYIDETDSQTVEKKEHTFDEWDKKFAELCSAYDKTGAKLLIMVDSADQLIQGDGWISLDYITFQFQSKHIKNIRIIITYTTDPSEPFWGYPYWRHYELRQLNDKDKLNVINGILTRNGKEISRPVINEMLGLESSYNPLYLSLLIQRLLMMNREDFEDIRSMGDGMAAIEQYQLELIRNQCPDDLDGMSAALLNEAGKRINEKFVSKMAQYLAISRNGLRKKDLAALLGGEWSELGFSHFINYMYDCFLLRDDGRYDFMHKSIRAGFCSLCEDLSRINKEILEYLKSLKEDDPVKISEIVYHAIAADDKKFFVDYIIKYKDNSRIIDHAAKDIRTQCLADEGQWVIDVLNEAKKYEFDEKLCDLAYFFIYNLNYAISGFPQESEIIQSVKTATTDFSEYLFHKFKSHKSKTMLALSYLATAQAAYDEYHTYVGDNINLALEMYEKAMTIDEELVAEFGVERIFSPSVYHMVARIYKKLGDSDNLSRALELYEKARIVLEQKSTESDTAEDINNLSRSYDEAIEIYETLGGDNNLKSALDLYKKELTIWEQFSKEHDVRFRLAHIYRNAAGTYEALGGDDNLKPALDLYKKDLAIVEQLTKESDTQTSKRDLLISYNNVARTYEALGGDDNLKLALDLYKKSLRITEQMIDESRYEENSLKVNLYSNCISVARILEKLDLHNNLEQMIELYIKAANLQLLTAELHNRNTDAYMGLRSCLEELLVFPSVSASDKKSLIKRCIKISSALYRTTGNDIYNYYCLELYDLLDEIS